MATIAPRLSIFREHRELLERFRRGERRALAAVYDHYVDDVAILVRRGFRVDTEEGPLYVPGAPDIETEHELIQESFLKAFAERARMAFDGVRPYRPFLLRIVKNAMIDRHRARKREARAGEGVGDIDALVDENAPLPAGEAGERDLDWKRLATATEGFVRDLDRESRELVRARFEEELSQDAAAEALQCSRRRIRTLEARVQRELRRYLKRCGLWG